MGTAGQLYAPAPGRIIRLLAMFLAVMLQAAVLLPGAVGAADPAVQNCPLFTRRYKAQLVQTHLAAAVGEAVTLAFTLEPPEPPMGFFLSVNLNLLQSPEPAKVKKPEILTGFPETSAVFRTPGIYRYAVVVSLIAKASCGGVKADTIFNGEAQVDIRP